MQSKLQVHDRKLDLLFADDMISPLPKGEKATKRQWKRWFEVASVHYTAAGMRQHARLCRRAAKSLQIKDI